ncbi:hypothetical protein PM082_024466 [Marasmius tenuissimus]|nr:hypothetical protein PM082_024466 [Marasmius tenuissimus]
MASSSWNNQRQELVGKTWGGDRRTERDNCLRAERNIIDRSPPNVIATKHEAVCDPFIKKLHSHVEETSPCDTYASHEHGWTGLGSGRFRSSSILNAFAVSITICGTFRSIIPIVV